MHAASCGLHFFASSNKMRPISALYQDIRQNCCNQFAWRIFVEQRHGIDRLQMEREIYSAPFVEKGPRRSFQVLHASVRI